MAIAQPKRVKEITKSISEGDIEAAATATIDFILDSGVNGFGPVKGAETIADEALKHSGDDVEKGVRRDSSPD